MNRQLPCEHAYQTHCGLHDENLNNKQQRVIPIRSLINTVCTRCSFIIFCWNVKVYFAELGGGSRVVRVVYSWACCLVYEVYSCTQNRRSWHYNFGHGLTHSPCLVTRLKFYTSIISMFTHAWRIKFRQKIDFHVLPVNFETNFLSLTSMWLDNKLLP